MLKQFSLVAVMLLSFNVKAIPELTTVGEGSYSYLFWQLYDARLATADGRFSGYQQSSPVLLELTYKRDISAKQFVDATVDEWQKLNNCSEAQQQAWAGQLITLWRDVKEGDALAALLVDDGSVMFYLNGEVLGAVQDSAFGPAFFDIWLHPDTSAPKLRRQLIAAK